MELFLFGLAIGLFVGLGAARFLAVWIGAVSSGAPFPLAHLIGMRVRRTPVQLVADAHVALVKRGLPSDINVLEAAYLAHRSDIRTEQDLVRVVQASPGWAELVGERNGGASPGA